MYTCMYTHHTHMHDYTTRTLILKCYTPSSGEPNPEQDAQAKQLEEQMKKLELRQQQLEREQTDIIKRLRGLQAMEKQSQEAMKAQGQPASASGVTIKMVLRKRLVVIDLVCFRLGPLFCLRQPLPTQF